MAKVSILQAATSVTINIFIADSSSTTGAGLTGLVFNTAGLTCYYMRPKIAATAVTLATLAAVTTAFSSGGFKEIDATNAPGWYRFDIPDAAIANAERFCSFHFKGATNMAPLPLEVELTGWNNQSATDGGLSKLTSLTFTGANKVDASVRDWIGGTIPAVNVTGVPLVDAKYLLGTIFATPATAGIPDVNVKNIDNDAASASGTVTFPNATLASTTNITAGTIATVTTVTNQLTAAAIATGVWQDATAGDFTTASSIGKSLYTAGVVPGGTNGLFIAGTNAATTITTALTTTFTGNLTGSVGSVTGAVGSVTGAAGSVTGAVGSVTGNVGGNVVGTVASVVGAVGSVTGNVGGNVTGSVGSVVGAVGSVTGNVGGNVVGTVASVVGAVGSVTGLTASNLDATISSRMATYTQPSGFLAATFPTGTIANTTNITAGVITTVTTLTNAPGDSSGVTTLLSRIGGTITISGGIVSADLKKINAVTVNGNGAGTPWGP